jgi:hypothetical protein
LAADLKHVATTRGQANLDVATSRSLLPAHWRARLSCSSVLATDLILMPAALIEQA